MWDSLLNLIAMIVRGLKKCFRACLAFIGGFALGQIYYNFMLRELLTPGDKGSVVSLVLSVTLGIREGIGKSDGAVWRIEIWRIGECVRYAHTRRIIVHYLPRAIKQRMSQIAGINMRSEAFFTIARGLLNVAAIQIRCISLLTFPMYLGKDGRRVLKGLILTYVVSGPILNMSLNAREVVRVYACSDELTHKLSRARHDMIDRPLRDTVAGMGEEIAQTADTFRYFQEVTAPIESEIELTGELKESSDLTRTVDALLNGNRSDYIEQKYRISPQDNKTAIYQKEYLMKTEYRCNNLLSQAVLRGRQQMAQAWQACRETVPGHVAFVLCAPLMSPAACDVPSALGADVCDSREQVSSGLCAAYAALKRAKAELVKGPDEINITYRKPDESEVYDDVQAVKQTGDCLKQAFEDKFSIIQSAIAVVNLCQALLFLRIVVAAQAYHDFYLTSIDYDNVYITDLFRKIERRRLRRNQYTLLPLKKMERNRYVDVYSLAYSTADQHRLLAQTLKLLLEVVTATTFVMLDRLFYEALDMVRLHALLEGEPGTKDLEIEVEGSGIVANTLRAMLSHLSATQVKDFMSNTCLPKPRIMPAMFYLRIYGGYFWVLVLLCVNPYTVRLRRLICSYFYPRREKQRVLHLYNDILKKRVKLDATLRRKAVQSVRAHYLSGESLLMRFPNVLGWLRALPAARMTCLICGEIEPRNAKSGWKACALPKCPFIYCEECWFEIRGRCLACDPSLAELSDQDSLSDDELPVY